MIDSLCRQNRVVMSKLTVRTINTNTLHRTIVTLPEPSPLTMQTEEKSWLLGRYTDTTASKMGESKMGTCS